jgi:polyribonucleotide nucleotidyltransferase
MDLNRKIYKTNLDGEELSLEFSKLAGQANGSVLGRYGDTAVLATAVMSQVDKPGDFFPLTVDYEERFYAAGKIIGSRYVRREGRPSDDATLSARLIDRTIRPLFDPRLRREVQVTITVLAYDEKNDPDVIGLLAASAALATSDIPWQGPVAGVKITSEKSVEDGGYQAFFAGTDKFVNMIEFGGKEISESEITHLFRISHEKIKSLIEFERKIIEEIGKPKAKVTLIEADLRLRKTIEEFLKPAVAEALQKKEVEDLKARLFEYLAENGESEEIRNIAEVIFEEYLDNFVHEEVIHHGRRVDGRAMDEVRDLLAEVGLFRRTHGSAIFARGDTHVLAVTTLAAPGAEQLVETMEGTTKKRFMLHYNFPKFATGEAGRAHSPGRREIGHGALAAKAIAAMLPKMEDFPYTIRIVAETLSSNGSSSQASTCAASLSLMDAGVPIAKHVAGIAIGLMSDDQGHYKILTDIQGPEDHYGDMDFKVAGTRDGVNAIQMDVKIGGINEQIFTEALAAARKARWHILDVMERTIAHPRKEISPFAPKIFALHINPEKIGELIGPGGKIINGIIAECNNQVSIDIEEDGSVFISGTDLPLVDKARRAVQGITKEYQVGEIVEGPIVKLLDFGAIVDLGGGRDGMIHISEFKDGFVKDISDVAKVGEMVRAKVIRVEEGKIALSVKQLKEK